VTLPVSSVRRDADGSRVLKVEDGRVERADVVAGLSDEPLIVIESGLRECEAVVARAGAFVRPGERIRPVPADPVPAQAPASPGARTAAVAGGGKSD
jgi:HlyD family secretion protein